MTNKLPVVGKKYRSKPNVITVGYHEIEIIQVAEDWVVFNTLTSEWLYRPRIRLRDFFNFFEELPEENTAISKTETTATCEACYGCGMELEKAYSKGLSLDEKLCLICKGTGKVETTATKDESNCSLGGESEVSDVEKTKEELKKELTLKETCKGVGKDPNVLLDGFFRIYDKAKALLEALDLEKAMEERNKREKEDIAKKFEQKFVDALWSEKESQEYMKESLKEELKPNLIGVDMAKEGSERTVETLVLKEGLSDEVKEAMKKLEEALDTGKTGLWFEVIAHKFLNALNKQFKEDMKECLAESNIPENPASGITGYTREGQPKSIWKESIWKDVSELPKAAGDFYLRMQNGCIITGDFIWEYGGGMFRDSKKNRLPTHAIEQYCTLTDYINNIEESFSEIRERLSKLEGK